MHGALEQDRVVIVEIWLKLCGETRCPEEDFDACLGRKMSF